ncbi:MAG: isochorismate synthase [Prevotella sp.]|nr:isochorismate synthase [Prevotella sp.]
MSAYAIYRLPHADRATLIQQTEGEPSEYQLCSELNGKRGFVVAPFQVTVQQPILLIRPDVVNFLEVRGEGQEVRDMSTAEYSLTSHLSPLTSSYAIDFANYHAQLETGLFRKIVLARCVDEASEEPIDPMELFRRACMLYPRMFISLVSTPKSGVWLTATPEILLEGKGSNWRTIALAGTMKLAGDQLIGEGETVCWPTKDIQEQRIVTTYIAECLEQFTGDFHEEGPRTVRAANLVHLRSDFTFSLQDCQHLGDLLHVLHPTPAVCGLPKRETFNFIIQNEHSPRRYYSGFMGMLDPVGDTHLYVSLRCMNIEGNHYHLYAGGGLLKDSILEQEWQETEAKLETMRRCIAIKKM